jgi:hypothetical protein
MDILGEVKAVRNVPGNMRRVDVKYKDKEKGLGAPSEKASIYMKPKDVVDPETGKNLKVNKKYEFRDLSFRNVDKERGGGSKKFGQNRKSFSCETPPEPVTKGETFKGFGGVSSRKSKTAKWFHS